MSKFSITANKGFQLTFPNGYMISVQFGPGNYCGNRHNHTLPEDEPLHCATAEVAVYRDDECVFADGKDGTGCCGWLTTDIVAKMIAATCNNPTDADAVLRQQLRTIYKQATTTGVS